MKWTVAAVGGKRTLSLERSGRRKHDLVDNAVIGTGNLSTAAEVVSGTRLNKLRSKTRSLRLPTRSDAHFAPHNAGQ